eukprot:scaffold4201_cov178-Amphora_coffeaeformis.AAC.2
MDEKSSRPLVAFQAVPHNSSSSSITSLCFLGRQDESNQSRLKYSNMPPQQSNNPDADEGGSSEEEDEFESHFSRRSNDNGHGKQGIIMSSSAAIHDRLALEGVKLATCDFEGNALIWDVTSSTVVGRIVDTTRGPGLALRRIVGEQQQQSSRFLYHTRDPQGLVSLHDVEKLQTVAAFSTQSHTFCAAVPCQGDENLVALPSIDGSEVVVRDWRASPSSAAVVCFVPGESTVLRGRNHHGMLTSLAMWKGQHANILLCGMEDGSLWFHDWTRMGHGVDATQLAPLSSHISLGTDPILTLDISPSPEKDDSYAPSFVCLAGLAGDAEEVGHLDESDRGRIAVVKASRDENGYSWRPRIRTRLGTAEGKPGVAVCRFRPDGRVFVAGGWDRRVRVFHRDGRALAILRGHGDGIQAVDWFPDASTGLLASGSSDGRVCIWRAFGTI